MVGDGAPAGFLPDVSSLVIAFISSWFIAKFSLQQPRDTEREQQEKQKKIQEEAKAREEAQPLEEEAKRKEAARQRQEKDQIVATLKSRNGHSNDGNHSFLFSFFLYFFASSSFNLIVRLI